MGKVGKRVVGLVEMLNICDRNTMADGGDRHDPYGVGIWEGVGN